MEWSENSNQEMGNVLHHLADSVALTKNNLTKALASRVVQESPNIREYLRRQEAAKQQVYSHAVATDYQMPVLTTLRDY